MPKPAASKTTTGRAKPPRQRKASPRARPSTHVNPYPSLPQAPQALKRVRQICLALPESAEKIAWGAPTFRVKDKIFVMFVDNHHGDGRVALWCNAPAGSQQALVASDPDVFFSPPYVGCKGWLGIRLDRGLDWSIIAELAKEAYRATAPARLLPLLDDA